MLIGDNESLRIFNTCIAIAHHIHSENPAASFGFIGTSGFDEGSMENTKRYRIYKKLATTYFPLERFNHQRDDDNSLYLLLNLKNNALNTEMIIEKMYEMYE